MSDLDANGPPGTYEYKLACEQLEGLSVRLHDVHTHAIAAGS
jgi:hypothetical protein